MLDYTINQLFVYEYSIENLKKKGNKFFVLGSSAKEYYVILDSGHLEMRDEKGLLTTATNIFQNVLTKTFR